MTFQNIILGLNFDFVIHGWVVTQANEQIKLVGEFNWRNKVAISACVDWCNLGPSMATSTMAFIRIQGTIIIRSCISCSEPRLIKRWWQFSNIEEMKSKKLPRNSNSASNLGNLNAGQCYPSQSHSLIFCIMGSAFPMSLDLSERKLKLPIHWDI